MNEQKVLSEFRSKFNVEELQVVNSGSWTWSIRPAQVTLGSSILSLNRYALHLSDVKPEEMAELGTLIQLMEKTIKTTFNHDIMNYLMLMMVDRHVHYHVIPRYNGIRTFSGLEWVDNGWPALPVMGDNQHKNQDEVLKDIQKTLINSL
jgi:diadenosine tetraphosphate (Ap4A) HIT family hydrolase